MEKSQDILLMQSGTTTTANVCPTYLDKIQSFPSGRQKWQAKYEELPFGKSWHDAIVLEQESVSCEMFSLCRTFLWKWHNLLRKLCHGQCPGYGKRVTLAEYVFLHVCRYVPICCALQCSCCGFITLHVGYNLLYIMSILYGTYYAAKLMDTWKGLLEFVIFLLSVAASLG